MARALGRSYTCLTAADAELALKTLEENPDIGLILTDYKMPGKNGIELIQAAKAAHPGIGAILITAFGEIELAVRAMKEGADDFLTKPILDLEQLEMRIAKCMGKVEGRGEGGEGLGSFTGESAAMQRLYGLIRKVAPSNANVLIEGPSGTGKELVARAVHALSGRAQGPFIAVECSALSKDLLESELFGYAPGSFTGGLKEGKAGCFEAAKGGTLFLDEIGEVDLGTQVKLLRALESRTITRIGSTTTIATDFRLVAATNKNLAQLVVEGRFREDLYYRLNVIGITMPPLKDRPGDIPLLAERFLKEFAAAYKSKVRTIAPEAMAALEAYEWPGNVRQLRNVMERTVVLAGGERIEKSDLPPEMMEKTTSTPPLTMAEREKEQILGALEAAGGNKSKAAEKLGISRRTIHRKLKEWKID